MTALKCELCGLPIPHGDVEWINVDGEQKPFHTGARYDPDTCAYIARHRKEYFNKEAFITTIPEPVYEQLT